MDYGHAEAELKFGKDPREYKVGPCSMTQQLLYRPCHLPPMRNNVPPHLSPCVLYKLTYVVHTYDHALDMPPVGPIHPCRS